MNWLPSNSNPPIAPLTFLLGNMAGALRAHPTPGVMLMDEERRIIGFDLEGTP